MTTETSTAELDFDAAFEEATNRTASKPESSEKQPAPSQEPAAQTEPEKPAAQPEETVESLKAKLGAVTRERDEALHKWRSDANRQSNLMRENNQLKEQVASLKQQLDDVQKAAPKPSRKREADPNDVLESAPDLKAAVERRIEDALADRDEKIAELLGKLNAAEARLAEVGQKASETAQRVEPIANREEQQRTESIRGELDKLYPGWRVAHSSGEIKAWVETQPPRVKALYDCDTLEEAKALLGLFYTAKGASKPPADAGKGAESRSDLRDAAGIAPRTVTRVAPNKEDFEGAFAEFSARRKR